MTKRKMKYYDNPVWDVAFERCIDVLAELIEKYGDRVLRVVDGHHNSKTLYDYAIIMDEKFILCELGNALGMEIIKAYGDLKGEKQKLLKSA